MKQTLFKQLLMFMLFSLVSFGIFAQQKYHRIQSTISAEIFEDLMAAGLDIDHYHYQEGVLQAEVSDQDIQLFKSKNVKFKYLIEDFEKNIHKHNAAIDKANAKTRAVTVPTPVNFGIGGSYGTSTAVAKHFTFQDMQNELDDMRALYPNLITIKSSIGTTGEGRSIFMVRLSDNADTDENEPEVLLNAVHHAREPMSMTQLIFFMWHLLENYNTDKEIQTLVNSCEMYIVPCVNPDGYVYNQTTNPTGGGMWRKNRRNNGGGIYGVDDNRNYAYGWGGTGSSGTTSSDTYRGSSAFSEPETQAIRNLCNSRNFITAFNYHSYGNYCIYPYSNVSVNNNPEIPFFNQLSTFLTTDNAFVYGNAQATVSYVASGGAEDWSYAEQTTKGKMYGFTPEVGLSSDGFWPAATRIIPLCNSMIVMNKNMLKVTAPFAQVNTTQAATITSLNGSIPFNIQNFSILPASYTVTVNPLSTLVNSVDAPKIYSTLNTFQSANSSFNYSLDPSITAGTILSFEVITYNNHHERKDTINVTYNCAAPASASTSGITTNSANISWAAVSGSTDYYVSTKLASSSTWDPEVLVSGSISTSLTGLTQNTAYNWRVRAANCSNNSATQNFTTLQVCGTAAPSASAITSSGFTLTWAAVGSATSYDIQTRQLGSSTWTTTNVTTTNRVVTGLSASTVYEYQVRANCPSGAGAYSAIQTVTTSNVTAPTYCASNGNNTSMEWIDRVQLGTILRTSAAETGGYINTGLSTNLVRGTSYTLTYSAGFSSTVYKENWRVYIDYNADGDFTDAGETVISASRTGSGNYTGTFTVPTTASLTTTRMRVKMSYSSISSPCGSFTYGEVEDYNVTIGTSLAKTSIPNTSNEENLIVDVMPNPFMEQINILLEDNYQQSTNITLTDITGKILHKETVGNDKLSTQLNTADIPSGIYMLQIQNGDRRKTVKMIK